MIVASSGGAVVEEGKAILLAWERHLTDLEIDIPLPVWQVLGSLGHFSINLLPATIIRSSPSGLILIAMTSKFGTASQNLS